MAEQTAEQHDKPTSPSAGEAAPSPVQGHARDASNEEAAAHGHNDVQPLHPASEPGDEDMMAVEDVDPRPAGAIMVTAVLAAVILILWYSMFALNFARG